MLSPDLLPGLCFCSMPPAVVCVELPDLCPPVQEQIMLPKIVVFKEREELSLNMFSVLLYGALFYVVQVKDEEFVQRSHWRSNSAPSDREISVVPRDDKFMHGQRLWSSISTSTAFVLHTSMFCSTQ